MSKIVYLLGAGASRGVRGDDVLKFTTDSLRPGGHFVSSGECPDILSGVPIVSEIPSRLESMIHRMWNIKNNDKDPCDKNILAKLIDDLEWLQKESARHATIDTFAKKLFLTQKEADYECLKKALLAFLFFEQAFNEPDQRYDSFLASILQSDVNHLPDEISVVSWNYDFQFELAYSSYVSNSTLSRISEVFLHSHDKLSERRGGEPLHLHKGFNLLKLNGSAFVSDDNTYARLKTEDSIQPFLEMYAGLNKKNNRISFAWEKMSEQYKIRIANCVKDAEVLVIIGYSFPFFNREVDRVLFEKMHHLKKIYIQDPNAETVKMSLKPVLTDFHMTVNHVGNQIFTLAHDPKQFFMPPEL